MKFKDTACYETYNPMDLKLSFGDYYFCNNFIIGEIFEGVHIDWDKAEKLISEVIKHYGKDAKIAYIANRINPYSIDPQNWLRIEKNYNFLIASAIVVYNDANYINVSLEKQFTSKSIKRCLSLNQAIAWIEKLEEFS